MTHQEYNKKLERGLAQVRAGQGITKTMEELEHMAEVALSVSPDKTM